MIPSVIPPCIFATIVSTNLCSQVSENFFNHTFDQSHYPKGMFACDLYFIWQLSFVKKYPACCSRHSVYVFSINSSSGILSTFYSIYSYDALKISFNHRNQTDVPSLKDFSKKTLHFHLFLSSHSNLFF